MEWTATGAKSECVSGLVSDVCRLAAATAMAADVAVRASKCKLDKNECVSLLNILKSFNAPINEEHVWALCYQCAKCFKAALEDRGSCKVVTELEQVLIHRDGQVHANTILQERISTNEG